MQLASLRCNNAQFIGRARDERGIEAALCAVEVADQIADPRLESG
jgi:hypothetical protein